MVPQQWEDVTQERLRDWEQEVRYRQLLTQLPQRSSRWRQWTASVMVWVGSWLLRWGEKIAEHECPEGVSVAG